MSAGRARIHELVSAALSERARNAGLGDAPLSDDMDVLGSGIVDSLGFVDLLMMVESELGIPLALEQLDFERLGTLGGMIDALHELAGER